MFSRCESVVVEEVENADASFGDNIRQNNPAYAHENKAVTIAEPFSV
jgi:hypothetical protein